MQEFVDQLNSYLWSTGLNGLGLAAGIFFSLATKVQVRQIKEMVRLLISGKSSLEGFLPSRPSPFLFLPAHRVAGVAASQKHGQQKTARRRFLSFTRKADV